MAAAGVPAGNILAVGLQYAACRFGVLFTFFFTILCDEMISDYAGSNGTFPHFGAVSILPALNVIGTIFFITAAIVHFILYAGQRRFCFGRGQMIPRYTGCNFTDPLFADAIFGMVGRFAIRAGRTALFRGIDAFPRKRIEAFIGPAAS